MARPRKTPTLRLETAPQSTSGAAASSRLDGSGRRFANSSLSPSNDANRVSATATTADRFADEFWSIGVVVAKTGLSRASIYRYVASGLFPDRRSIGPGRVAWLASEVSGWIETRPRGDPL
jgi:prophage regulatory protein